MKVLSKAPILLAIALAILLFAASCDCGDDDDDDNDDDHSCEDLCEKDAECNAPCVEGDCVTYCEENMTVSMLECAGLSSCDLFNACICNTGDDDDTSDDDDNDNDNDDDDDDDNDDDTVTESYVYDDGTMEYGESDATDIIHAITMTPSGYPAYLTEVSAYFRDTLVASPAFRVVILADEDADGPEDAEIVFTSDDIPIPSASTWVALDLTSTTFSSSLNSGSWIVGVQHASYSDWSVGIDDSVETPACYWRSGAWLDGPSWDGIYMIRGEGYY